MGAVYKARDLELDRLVAIKVIRPELAQNATDLHRFKQELILARQVTQRNVIRIFDLGEADGIKFISMEFIDGRDLKSLLRESGKFDPQRAAAVIEQVCRALEAAHAEGVIHRDLKPQNVMIGSDGKVSVLDFGVARSMDVTAGATQTGTLVGTPQYMSPEQARGEKVDGRTDLFSLGLIFYELLTADLPFKADTEMATLYRRTKESARPPVELNPDVPLALNNIVVRCLETDKEKRYASASEILRDLANWRETSGWTGVLPRWLVIPVSKVVRHPKRIAAAAGLILLVFAGAYAEKFATRRTNKVASSGPSVSLAILPFSNASGDQTLDWLGPFLADMLSTDVGQSSHLRAISPDRVHQIMHDLQISAESFSDSATIRRLAEMSDADTIVSGRYAKLGQQVRLDATLRDIKHDRSVAFTAEAASEDDLSPAIDRLAQTIRDNLSLHSNIVNELRAQSFKATSKSLEALRSYSQGTELAREGKNIEALKQFQSATEADPEFALAFAKLGQTYANLGHDPEAEQASRKAVGLSDNLPAREKYLILAADARIEHDYPKAIQYYETLATSSPDDPEIQFELARLYEDTGVIDKARDHYSKILAGDQNNVGALLALGRLELRKSNPKAALDYFNRGLPLAVQFGNNEAKGTLLQGIGVSYQLVGKQAEALQYFHQALEVRQKLGDKRGVAVTLNVIGEIEQQNGNSAEALKDYEQALNLRRDIGDQNGVANTLVTLGGFHLDQGHYDEALSQFKEALGLQRGLGDEASQGLSLNNIGLTYLSKGDYENAQTYFQQALELRQKSQVPGDIAFALHNLAVTSEKLGQYDAALSYYERALDLYRSAGDKRSAAMDAYGRGVLFGYQGRFGAAINAKKEALETFTESEDRTYWMTEVMSGYGMAMADAGKFAEAKKPLDDSLTLARELKIEGSIAQALDFQGQTLFYRGDLDGARNVQRQALESALHSKEEEKILISKLHLAQIALGQGKRPEAVVALRKLVAETDRLGMKYLSFNASALLGQALVESKDYAGAKERLGLVIAGAEKLDLRTTLAQAHYWLGQALRATGHSTEANTHYREALRYLEEIRKDSGTDAVLERYDLKTIYSDSTRLLQTESR